jgi:two-component system, NtrC family, nitrogen regulation sensor histidine kinase NtrY
VFSLILVALFFLLAAKMISGILQYGLSYVNGSIIIGFCFIITILLILVGTHCYHFFLKKNEGFYLQLQLVVLFVILIIFASVPQTLLAINVLEGVMELWVGDKLEETLEDSSRILTSYYTAENENLSSLANSALITDMLLEYRDEEIFPWDKLKEINLFIDSIQIFSEEGVEIYGDPSYAVDQKFIEGYSNTYLPVRNSHEMVLLRYVKNEGDLRLIFTSSLIAGTVSISRQVDKHIERLISYNQYKQDGLRWNLYGVVFFLLPLMLISINLGLLFARNMTRPIQDLGMALKKVTEGDYSYRISPSEFGIYDFFVDIFNEMIDELNSSRSELVQTEKIGVWRDIAQRLAHEIRNPLTPIKLNAQRIILKTSEMDEETQKYLVIPMNRILKEVDELDLLLREFREFAGQRAPVLRKLELSKLVDEVWDSYGKVTQDVMFSLHDEETDRTILGDAPQLKQVFRNIFANALDAMDNKGRLSVRVTSIIKGNTSFCRIAVRDWGRGIDQETLSRIFEPYYTTRKTGTGLGLPIVERIITDHKGRIWVESFPGEGTVFYIDLPVGRDL